MKIYISGKITGLPINEARQRFAKIEAELAEIGNFEPVNPLKIEMPENATWAEHMVKDIETLIRCDAIYLMDNWVDSKGSQIEYEIAEHMGLEFIYQSDHVKRNRDILKIQQAIHEVTGMRLCEYNAQSRKIDGVFARMIFVFQCRRKKMKLKQIAKYIHRDHSTILHLLKKYDEEMKYNSQFRQMAKKIDNILNKTIK